MCANDALWGQRLHTHTRQERSIVVAAAAARRRRRRVASTSREEQQFGGHVESVRACISEEVSERVMCVRTICVAVCVRVPRARHENTQKNNHQRCVGALLCSVTTTAVGSRGLAFLDVCGWVVVFFFSIVESSASDDCDVTACFVLSVFW